MKIIKYKKISNDKYKIYLENSKEVVLYEDVIVKNNLLFEKNIDEKLLKKLEKDNSYISMYNMALKYISLRMRSKYEILCYLQKKDISIKLANDIVFDLEKKGYINDKAFAKAYISDQLLLSNNGPLKIKRNLESLKVDIDIINLELENIDNNVFKEKLKNLITKQVKIKKGSKSEIKLKLLKYFTDLGYSREYILQEIDNLKIENDSTLLKKEYLKMHNKYKRKYDSKELDYIIENKLYIKGYSHDEIRQIKKELI